MLKNYILVAIRNILRHKGYSFINIAGLAVGLASCILILIYVTHELTFDRYHDDVDRVRRVAVNNYVEEQCYSWAASPEPLGPALRHSFPQIESVARIQQMDRVLVKTDAGLFYENQGIIADAEIFEVLTIPFVTGDKNSALDRPGTAIITTSLAEKYFGDAPSLNKNIKVNDRDYEITGIVADPPSNTHLKYSIILPFRSFEPNENMSHWGRMSTYTYLKLAQDADNVSLLAEINRTIGSHASVAIGSDGWRQEYFFQPIADIHLVSHLKGEFEPPGDPTYLVILSVVGILVLAVACANFVNLSTARSAQRTREVGMRKVVGAGRWQLITQFQGEAVILTGVSVLLGCLVAEVSLPLLSDLTKVTFTTGDLFNTHMLLLIAALGLLVSVAAGGYPAFALAARKPLTILRGTASETGGTWFRRILVVGQFVVSVLLIVGSAVIIQQLDYMRNLPLGFEQQQKLILPVREDLSIESSYTAIKSELSTIPSVTGATTSSAVPGRIWKMHMFETMGAGERLTNPLFHLYIDQDFLPEYDIQLIAGRAFNEMMSTDLSGAAIINETAVRAFGWPSADSAIGKQLSCGHQYTIIGVTKDFHFSGLQNPVAPLFVEMNPTKFQCITLTVDAAGIPQTLSQLKQRWLQFFPDDPFQYYFLDSDFNRQYGHEERIARIAGSFTILAVFIACLGLLGLVSFSAQARTKEISIRKVLGASVASIIGLLTRELVILVVVANVIAWPLAYYALNTWLQDFAYRIEVGWGTFGLAGVLVLLAALSTVSLQAAKAARTNPAQTLKYE